MSGIGEKLKQLCDAFNAHDLDEVMAHFADDCVLEMPRGDKPWGSRAEGKAAVRKALAGRFEGLPDVHYGSEQHFVDESANTGMSKWMLTGTARTGSGSKSGAATSIRSATARLPARTPTGRSSNRSLGGDPCRVNHATWLELLLDASTLSGTRVHAFVNLLAFAGCLILRV